MSLRRSRSAMMRDIGRPKRSARAISSVSVAAKCRALKRPVFGSTRASACNCGTASDRWTSTSGATANGIEPGVHLPERVRDDAEPGQHEIRREMLEVEERRLPEGVPARKPEHQRQHRVIDRDECRASDDASHGKTQRVRVDQAPGENSVCEEPHGHRADDVVADVERLQIPAVAHSQPLRHVLDDPHQGHLLGR